MKQKKIFESVFVRGLSRSGGTMLTTILDTHRDISMSYELYPNVIKKLGLDNMILGYELLKKNKNLLKFPDLKMFNVFFLRAQRSGITKEIFLDCLEEQLNNSTDIEKIAFEFIRQLCQIKMMKEKKRIWGAKCSNQFNEYIDNYDNTFIFAIVRDGRDVCVSQLKNLKRESQTVESIAQSWVNYTIGIYNLTENYDHSHIIIYENLVNDPEKEIKIICDKLQLEFDRNMLSHNDQDLTIFKSNHISMPNLIKPINNQRIGLWRNSLSKEDIKIFNTIAGEQLEKFNYSI